MSTATKNAVREVFGSRLMQARKMRGVTLRELAGKLDGLVSANALNKYENAQMMPGEDVVVALAAALGVSVDFFFRSFRVNISGVHFRKRSTLGKKAETALEEQARDFFERYLEVEEILGVREPFESPLEAEARTVEDAEALAQHLRKEWDLGGDAIPNVVELLEEKNIKVFAAPSAPRTFDGFSGAAGENRVVVIGDWLDKNVPRKRMTLAHELAHVAVKTAKGLAEHEHEQIARRFAGAFLLPKKTLEGIFGTKRSHVSLQEFIEIKAVFGISIWAVAHRAHALGWLTDAHYRQFCMYANQQHWRTEGEPGDERFDGKEESHRFKALVYRALSEEFITMSKAASLLGEPVDVIRNGFSVVT